MENFQVAVYLVYIGSGEPRAVHSSLVDRRRRPLPGRGQPRDRAFANRPEVATVMIERFLETGHHTSWVAADEVYGGNPKLRAGLEKARHGLRPCLRLSSRDRHTVRQISVRHPGRQATQAGLGAPARLVRLATPPPGPSSKRSLPTTSRSSDVSALVGA
ncbi:transposase [Streptomyces sp. NPDC013187]|uniref:transposase n=1 Tax=Streptomyces sp. NPDC013187 TaxID=3364865 RepID=UPI00367A5CF7